MLRAMGARSRVVIAEDHTILRQGLVALLARSEEIEVVGEAADGLEAIDLARRLRPDLVLMDVTMPRLGGLDATREITRRLPATRVLALTAHASEEYAAAALDAGAAGYILKDASSAELLEAVRQVISGGTVLSVAVAGAHVRRRGKAAPGEDSGWESLTPREREVLRLVAEGRRSRDIAAQLGISVKTVERHRANLMGKLGTHSAPALTAFAVKKGLVS